LQNTIFSFGFLLLTTLFLFSCATNKVSDLYDFHPIETVDSRKVFEYRYVLGESESRQPLSSSKAFSFVEMRKELNKYMDVYPYCNEGFFVYDELFNGREYTLLGECQEPKTNE